MIFLRNVLRARARSLMTVFGLAAGVGLFVSIHAIVDDIERQIAGVAHAYSLEVLIQERRATSPFDSRIGVAQMRELQARFGAAVSPVVIANFIERWNPYVLVIGVPAEFMRQTSLVAGAQVVAETGEALLGEIASQQLRLGPGQSVTVAGRELRISGIFRTGSRALDGGVMTGIAQAQQLAAREGSEPGYSLALVRSANPEDAARMIAAVEREFPTLKAVPGTEFAGSLRLMRVLQAFVNTILAVALAGTLLVVTNTLLMAIAERTREIGILMTVGWTPWLVLRMLLAESVLLCVIGAALGNVFALALLRVLNGIESIGFGWLPLQFPWSLTAQSFAVALGVGVVALAWPAVIVFRLQPLSALRHE